MKLPPHLIQKPPRHLPVVRTDYGHSVSSLNLGRRCENAWWFLYGEGLALREVTWASVEAGEQLYAGERSRSFGTTMHGILEDYVNGEATAESWLSDPGHAAEAIASYLPEDLSGALTEVSIGAVDAHRGIEGLEGAAIFAHAIQATAPLYVPAADPNEPGIVMRGFIDLRSEWSHADAARTGIPAGEYCVDYKSSTDPAKWALSGDALCRDLQACTYRVALRDSAGVRSLWLYAKSRGTPAVYPQVVEIKYLSALARVREEIPLARRLEAILAGEIVPEKNTESCHDYGGCPYAAAVGGPCYAKPNGSKMFARAIQAGAKKKTTEAKVKKGVKMAIKSLQERAAEAAKSKDAPGEAAEEEEIEVTVEGEDDGPAEETPAEETPTITRRPRPSTGKGKKGKSKASGAQTAKASGALAEALETAQIKLAEVTLAKGALAQAEEALAAALADVQKAGAS